MTEVRTPEPLDATLPWATVSLYTETELQDERGVRILSAQMDMGGEGGNTPWVTVETNYMSSTPDGTLSSFKRDITFPCELLPQLRQMLESLEVRVAALPRVVEEIEAPVRLATEVPARRMVRTRRVS